MKIEGNYLFTSGELSDKEKRNISIYDLLRKKGSISRAEITKSTGINAVSVSNYVNNFIEKKMVIEKGFDVSTGGRKPELIELNSESNYVIGIDVEKAEIRGVLADIGLNVKVRKRSLRPSDRETPEAIVRLVEEIIASSGTASTDVRAIGLGAYGLKCEGLVEIIGKKIGIDAYAGASAVCAAFAERRSNRCSDDGNVLYIHSDVGHGVMTHADTYIGAPEDEKFTDARRVYLRPWNNYLSIVEYARREVSRGVGTKIVSLAGGKIDSITRDVVTSAAKADDEVALNIMLAIGMNLGLRIAYLINLFNPETVVIGGGVQEAGDLVFAPIKKMVDRLAYRRNLKGLKIISSTLGEDAVDIGAASLATREIFLKA